MADGIEVRLNHKVVPVNRALSAKSVVLAHDLRRVEALSQRPLIFQLSQELLAGISGSLGNCETEGGKVLNLERFGVVGLAGDGDNLVVLVQVEEFELLVGQLLEGVTGAVDELLVGAGELEAFGLTLVGDLHGFLSLLLLRLHGD